MVLPAYSAEFHNTPCDQIADNVQALSELCCAKDAIYHTVHGMISAKECVVVAFENDSSD